MLFRSAPKSDRGSSVDCGNGPPQPATHNATVSSQSRYRGTASRALGVGHEQTHRTLARAQAAVNEPATSRYLPRVMADIRHRLQAALGAAYRLERELGGELQPYVDEARAGLTRLGGEPRR